MKLHTYNGDKKMNPIELYGLKTEAYAIIRNTEGKKWVDNSTISFSLEQSKKIARDTDKELIQWAETNKAESVALIIIQPVFIEETI